MNNVVICLVGSSIMEGRIGVEDPMDRWYNRLHAILSRRHPEHCFAVINSAVGGQSTREVIARLDRDVLPHEPDVCLFMAGANNHDCRNPERILAPGEFERLMATLAARLPEKTATVGVVLNPVVDAWHFATRDPAFRDHLARFAGSLDASLQPERDAARAFYQRPGWPCLDLYQLMAHDPGRYVLPEDGIHLNPAGHALFAEHMAELVSPLI